MLAPWPIGDKRTCRKRFMQQCVDGEQTLSWWHRNVARTQYGIQGWNRAKIYPDFIFAVQVEEAANRLTVLETKGDQLDNLDTAYKREVLTFLSDNFAWDDYIPAGELEFYRGKTGNFVDSASNRRDRSLLTR